MDPFRSEADAFRILLIVGAGALTVIVVALLLGSLAGFLWGLFLIGLGIGRIFRSRRALATSGDIAVVVDDVPRDELIGELRELEGGPQFLLAMIVAPDSPEADRRTAQQRMEVAVQLMQGAGLRTRGRVLEIAADDLQAGGPVPGVEAKQVIVAVGGESAAANGESAAVRDRSG